jgi:hypothetical protein
MIRSTLKTIFLKMQPVLLFPLRVVMDQRYLVGRHFEGQLTGVIWAYRTIWQRNILRLGRPQRVPMSLNCNISRVANLYFHPDDLNNLQSPNLYVQNYRASVTLGRGTYIGPNVGLITANHDFNDLDQHLPAHPIELGEKCWIGMNSVIMPGVSLGPRTIVGAGSVVTKSFSAGNCVIAGSPARLIRRLDGA